MVAAHPLVLDRGVYMQLGGYGSRLDMHELVSGFFLNAPRVVYTLSHLRWGYDDGLFNRCGYSIKSQLC